jgi:hypothetical protein
MKYCLIFFVTLFCTDVFAQSDRNLWIESDNTGKARLLESYKIFLLKYERSRIKQISFRVQNSIPEFLNSAWADEVFSCLYAGWPSLLVNEKCSSPLKNNPDYKEGSCGANSIQCQPLLFGNNICAPISSLEERQLAFSNCHKKFKEKGLTSEEVVKEIIKNKEEKKLLSLLDLADQICKSGTQSGTGMCKLLLRNLDEVKKMNVKLPEESVKVVVAGLENVQNMALSLGKNPKVDCVVSKVQTPASAPASVPVSTSSPAPLQLVTSSNALAPFERLTARIPMACGGARPDANGIDVTYEIDCKTDEHYPSGFAFSDNPGHPFLDGVKSLYPDGGTPTRKIEFTSRDHASNETYLYLTDVAGGPDSHDVKSVMILLPRLGVPITEVVGDDVILTMTTGEKVIFDKKTHGIKSGALKEGPIDLTTDRFKRSPPNVQYSGAGISIRVDHRYEYPTMGAVSAEIRQGSRVCKVSRGKIWNAEGIFLSNDDKTFVDILNKNCPTKAHEEAFHI